MSTQTLSLPCMTFTPAVSGNGIMLRIGSPSSVSTWMTRAPRSASSVVPNNVASSRIVTPASGSPVASSSGAGTAGTGAARDGRPGCSPNRRGRPIEHVRLTVGVHQPAPFTFAYGPSVPNPVTDAFTSEGLAARRSP